MHARAGLGDTTAQINTRKLHYELLSRNTPVEQINDTETGRFDERLRGNGIDYKSFGAQIIVSL